MKPLTLAGISAILLAVAVGFGAFGAHALKGKLDPYYMQVYEKAVFYQFIHILAALFLSLFVYIRPEFSKAIWVVVVMLLSTLIFSGSLYALVLSGIKIFGAITPIGGVGLIAAWLLLALILLF